MENIRIKNILVPVDFTKITETIINEALTIARLLKADLHFIHVIEYHRYQFSIVPETRAVLPTLLELEQEVNRRMNILKVKIRKTYGIIPKIFTTSGYTHTEIVNYAKDNKIDLIVMGTRGASKYKELFAGTNAQRVITLSETPVLTLQKRKKETGFRKILMPIDNSLHSREKVFLAMTIADIFGSVIHILGLPESKAKKQLDKFMIKLESVEKIIKADNMPYVTKVVQGRNLANAAIKYASKNNCDLIVINTGHESKVTGIFPGAFAQQIVNYSKIPVMSFKHSRGHLIIETPGYGIS